MSSQDYPIVEVEPDWVLEPETLGSKKKFWYRPARDAVEWLFKYPRADTGEHWAEKIASEVAADLRIPHATVELATFQGNLGSATRTFARANRELVHGNQILAGRVLRYEPRRKFKNSDHTLTNIWLGLDSIFQMANIVHTAKCRFSEYLVLDALIGNTDRHHENWGVLQIFGSRLLKERTRRRFGFDYICALAPSFDHASSLGRELADRGSSKSREARLASDRVADYAERARGGIYWSEDDQYGVAPLELVRRAADKYPDLIKPGLYKIRNLEMARVVSMLARMPEEWMTVTARRFAETFMSYSLAELKKLVK